MFTKLPVMVIEDYVRFNYTMGFLRMSSCTRLLCVLSIR